MSTAIEVRAKLQDKAKLFSNQRLEPISEGLKGALIGELNRKMGGDLNRQVCIGWLFTGVAVPVSTKVLGTGQWYALKEWIGTSHDDSGWHCSPSFLVESASVLTAALKSYLSLNPGLLIERMAIDSPMVAAAADMGGSVTMVTQLDTDTGDIDVQRDGYDGGNARGDPPEVPE